MKEEAGKLLYSLSFSLYTRGLDSRIVRQFANRQAIITNECDSLAQRTF